MHTLHLLEWDSTFFNKKIGHVVVKNQNIHELKKILQEAYVLGYELVYLFTGKDYLINRSVLKTFNGNLVGRKVIFSRMIPSVVSEIDSNIESFHSQEIPKVLFNLAYDSGQYSRFKKDTRRFNKNDFYNLYSEWLRNSVNRKISREVFVYKEMGIIQGFVTLSINDDIGNVGLIAVDSQVQSKGIGTRLLTKVYNYLSCKNIKQLNIPTQKENHVACNFYRKRGFNIICEQNVYHFF